MKISILLAVSLFFFSCKKSNESAIKLLRTEATDYNGILLTTEYVYDSGDRIIAIKQAENSATPAVAVTVTYNGNEITMLSYPKNDPVYNTTKEVRLTLDANGKPLKKIGYTYAVGSYSYNSSSKKFNYDTSQYNYDAAGFLKEIKQGLYDSSWAGPGNTIVGRSNATVSYTTVAANVTAKNEYAVYTRIITNAGTPNLTGGTSEYQTIYNYTKLYSNKTDFTNATVLNEFRNYNELLLDGLYKNMPEQLVMHTVDKDMNGTVYFNYTSTEEIERVYNDNGLLSAVNILTPTSQYRKFKYFYGR
jgi:hypothetical protein